MAAAAAHTATVAADDARDDAPPVEGCGVFAKQDLQSGDVMARIPKAACLSAGTSSFRDEFELEEREQGLSMKSGLALTVAVMAEQAKGQESKWFR
jgi:SET domain-containing protein 6